MLYCRTAPQLFLTKEYRPDGCYQVRLYEPKSGVADITPFDDSIPCFSGAPITKTRILGSEVWVLLLEKAVARLVVSAAAAGSERGTHGRRRDVGRADGHVAHSM